MKHIQALNDIVASIEHHDGNIWLDEGLLEHKKKDPEQVGLSHGDYESIMKQKVMATAMIKSANRTRYADVIASMRREYSCGLNTYPTTIDQAHNISNKHEALYKIKQRKSGSRYRGRFNNNNDNDTQYGLQYIQDDNVLAGITGKINIKIKCYEYNKNGYYADQCSTRNEENSKGEQHIQDTINNDNSTVISENNNIEGGQ